MIDEPVGNRCPGSPGRRSPAEDGPGAFYLRLGFRPTGETAGEQTVADLNLA